MQATIAAPETMPAVETRPPPQEGRPARDDETAELPSFYSPQSRALDHGRPADDGQHAGREGEAAAAETRRTSQLDHDVLSLGPLPAADFGAPAPASSHSDAGDVPPPSLLSPQFTPPATPGTATPSTEQPRSVPVDSSTPTGGCGTKKPRLLPTLPEVQCIVRARIPTVNGTEMFLHLYTNNVDNKEHLAIVFGSHLRSRSLDAPRDGETEMDRMIRGAYVGRLYPGRTESGMAAAAAGSGGTPQEPPRPAEPPLVRIHSECYTGETAWSARCDCGEQLDEAARLMALPSQARAGGIIIYLRQEGRGIGLGEKLKAYNLQDLGSDTVEANLLLRHPADARSYGLATAMLRDLGQDEVRLLTNNPDKVRAVEGPNREIRVVERVAMVPLSWKGKGEGFRSTEVEGYLRTKVNKHPNPQHARAGPRLTTGRLRRWDTCSTWPGCSRPSDGPARHVAQRDACWGPRRSQPEPCLHIKRGRGTGTPGLPASSRNTRRGLHIARAHCRWAPAPPPGAAPRAMNESTTNPVLQTSPPSRCSGHGAPPMPASAHGLS